MAAYTKTASAYCATPASEKSKIIVGRDRLNWHHADGRLFLFHGNNPNPLLSVEPDSKYTGMYRVRFPDGGFSDMVNLARAKDAACWFALRSLNSSPQETLAQGSQAFKKAEAVGDPGRSANRAQRPPCGLLARGQRGHRRADSAGECFVVP
jgi:hypothetical protein